MNVQAQPPITNSMQPSVVGRPPALGTPVPGTTGGLPAQGGLSVMRNPMAQALQSKGRGEDSMLVHMTPDEVSGLQNLAMAHGGSLTINPETGLPEAGFLNKILPTLLGVGLSFIPGVGPLAAAGIVGAGQTALTGDISKGLMAGLGAFGGASLAGALAPAAAGNAVTSSLAANAAPTAAGTTAGSVVGASSAPAISGAFGGGALAVPGTTLPSFAAPSLAGVAGKTGLAGIAQRFGTEAAGGLGSGMLAKYAPYAAGYGLLNSVSEATAPAMRLPEEQKSTYEGPYQAQPRKLMPRESGPGGEIQFFDTVNPYPGFLTREGNIPKGYAEGGEAAAAPALTDYVRMFQTSPGAITAPTAYPGGSPSELIRAAARNPTAGREMDYGFQKGTGAGIPMATPYTGGGLGDLSSILGALGSNYGGGTSGGGMSGLDLSAAYGNLIPSPQPYTTPNWSPVTLGNGQPLEFGVRDTSGLAGSGYGILDNGPKDNYPQGASLGLGTPTDVGLGLQGFGALGSGPSMADPYAGLAGDDLAEALGEGGGSGNRYVTKEDKDIIKKSAKGGEVGMDNGSFVVDARTVSELGNGSSNAGIEHLARMGGRPVRGAGDGVSDSVPARIGGRQEARVARDEVIFSPKAVAKLGGGDHKRGTQKLYGLMEKAHKARKQAKRGQDTGVAKGLGALS